MIVLAHRGWWLEPGEKNSATALQRAFGAGFGVETDIRDHDGAIVISHDPPVGPVHITLDALLGWYADAGQPGRLALNIKADGLQLPVRDALMRHGVSRAFVFDMAVPDAVGWLRTGIPCFTRESEIEAPAFIERAAGVWMDGFESDWSGEGHIRSHLGRGLDVALVSPELHGRPFEAAWQRWAALLSSPDGAELMLCTDFPDAALRFFVSEQVGS